MRITFPSEPPQYRGWNLTVGFVAQLDGQAVDCAVSAEALEDHFGAPSSCETDLLAAFSLNRSTIERVARRMLHATGTRHLLLRSGHFRFDAYLTAPLDKD